MIHRATPPGYVISPWLSLAMSRSLFYASGLVNLFKIGPLTGYQITGTSQVLYAADDVGKLKCWLFVRSGLVALGEMPVNAPLVPPFDLLAWFEEDPNGCQCPRCGESAVEGRDGRIWCQVCGVSQP